MNYSGNRSALHIVSNQGILRTNSISCCVSWHVEDYHATLLNTGQSICSEIFRVPSFSNCLFYLSISLDNENFLLRINRLTRHQSVFDSKCSKIKISFVIVDKSCGLCQREEIEMPKKSVSSTVSFQRLRSNYSLTKKNLEVQCSIKIEISGNLGESLCDSRFLNKKTKESATAMSSQELQEHLKVLLEGETDNRIDIHVGSHVFPVHKNLLCSHSPVFAAMFEHETLEKSKNEIHIPDIHPEVMGEILKFVYFGNIGEISSEKANEIYTAADKYCILGLKQKSFDVLTNTLNKSNLLHVLKLADRHSDEELKQVVIHFLVREGTEVIGTEEFLLFLRTECKLARDVMLYLMKMLPKDPL